MLSTRAQIKTLLEANLSQTAFRRGTSAFRYGLIPQGISDHLPIYIKLNLGLSEHHLFSWNLLADVHLYNNFLNISGSQLLAQLIDAQPGFDKNSYYSKTENKLFYFLAELAQYLYVHKMHLHSITPDFLRDFIHIDSQPSQLARSRNPNLVKEKIIQIETSRAEIIELFIQAIFVTEQHKSEFELMLKHALELIYHIQDEEGALRWKNRYRLLQTNKALLSKMRSQDIILLQEATNPKNILALLPTHYRLIEHKLDANTTDHCAIIYNENKYELLKEAKLNLEGKKPYIIAQLKNRVTQENFMIASIHHPGGIHDWRMQIVEQTQQLAEEKALPTFIAGDFNHCEENFTAGETNSFAMLYPKTGTSAGSDYGNLNKAIDALFTNEKSRVLNIERVNEVGLSPPALSLPFKISFFATKPTLKTANDEQIQPERKNDASL
jgi:endonuclease/exonuclease/phosphatase family metal-dependent hydrolase